MPAALTTGLQTAAWLALAAAAALDARRGRVPNAVAAAALVAPLLAAPTPAAVLAAAAARGHR